MGEATAGLFADGKITWKRSKDRLAPDLEKLGQDHPDLLTRYVKPVPGAPFHHSTLEANTMIKGLAITPPVIGRICIGKLVQNRISGYRRRTTASPSPPRYSTGGWLLHPLHQHYSSQKSGQGQEQTKIRAIPVRVLFNDSDLNLRAEYSAFDRQTGRPLCVGNGRWRDVGRKAWRKSAALTRALRLCRATGLQAVRTTEPVCGGAGDELGSFIFRTTGYNSVRTLAARLKYLEAVSGAIPAICRSPCGCGPRAPPSRTAHRSTTWI